MKDVTVKQVTLNVTDMDKINIVSSQAVFKVSSFTMDTRSKSSSPLVNSLVKNRLFRIAPDIDEPQFQFIHTMDLFLVDTMLRDSPDPVIHKLKFGLFEDHRLGTRKFGTSRRSSSTAAHVRCADALSCWNTKSLPDTLCITGSNMTSL